MVLNSLNSRDLKIEKEFNEIQNKKRGARLINLFCSFSMGNICNKTLLENVYSIKTIIRLYFLGSMQSKLMHTQSANVDWTSQFKMEIT